MTEQLASPTQQDNPEYLDQLYEQAQLEAMDDLPPPQTREQWLSSMFRSDLEHAAPFIDQFYYNPETGVDSLKHVLSGDVQELADGTILATGFHHEPSAGDSTYVDRAHLEKANAEKRRAYREKPFEPYHARAFIHDKPKVVVNMETQEVSPEKSSMYPKEYDALTVVKTIVKARDSRDKSKDEIQPNGLVKTSGEWFMIDDKTMMQLTLILDPTTQKIVTASPIVKNNYMSLNENNIKEHLGLS